MSIVLGENTFDELSEKIENSNLYTIPIIRDNEVVRNSIEVEENKIWILSEGGWIVFERRK